MKKLLVGLTLLTSISSFALTPFVEGIYGNEIEGCDLVVTTGDLFNTNVNRLIVEMDITRITPWGAVLTQTMESSIKQNDENGFVDLDNAAGIGSFIVVRVKFNADGTVDSFKAQKSSPNGDEGISEVVNCQNMNLKK